MGVFIERPLQPPNRLLRLAEGHIHPRDLERRLILAIYGGGLETPQNVARAVDVTPGGPCMGERLSLIHI